MTIPQVSVYPTALDTVNTLFGDPTNNSIFTVAVQMSNSDQSFSVNESITLVNVPTFLVFASGEIVYVTTKNNGTLVFGGITRGANPVVHNVGEPVSQVVVADYFRQYKSAILAIETLLGINGANYKHALLDGTIATDTLAGTVVRGDVMVGNSTPKWARLATGVVNTVLSSDGTDTKFQTVKTLFNATLSGNAFPGGAVAGDKFFRTDLGFDCYYDGTNWLSVEEYTEVIPLQSGLSATGSVRVRIRSGYNPCVTWASISTMVATTNDANNYWSIALGSMDLTIAHTTVIYTVSTATNPDTVSTYTDHSGAPSTPKPTQYVGFLNITATKNGTPGNFTGYYTIFYRLVIA